MLNILIVLILTGLLIVSVVQNILVKKRFEKEYNIRNLIEKTEQERLEELRLEIEDKRLKLEQSIEEERKTLDDELSKTRAELQQKIYQRQAIAEHDLSEVIEKLKRKRDCAEEEHKGKIEELELEFDTAQNELNNLKEKKEKSIAALKEEEEKEEGEKFYRIQLSKEDQEDIMGLKKLEKTIHNKDVIRKIIYKTYIEKPMNETFNRIGATADPGIYKIEYVSIDKEPKHKTYIGQSVNVRNRLREHVKSAIGISNIAEQEVHKAMYQEGLENFTFTVIDNCKREQLNSREKYWIDFYKSNDWGYNRTRGGS